MFFSNMQVLITSNPKPDNDQDCQMANQPERQRQNKKNTKVIKTFGLMLKLDYPECFDKCPRCNPNQVDPGWFIGKREFMLALIREFL